MAGIEEELPTFQDPEDALAPVIPFCPCGAGPCRRVLTSSGRAYLKCTIKEGLGSCGFFKWVDVGMVKMQDFIEQYNSEKLKFQSVSRKHDQMLSGFIASSRRLKSLREEICNHKKLLLEMEKEIACCEAETSEFRASCKEVGVEVTEAQKRMQETALKLGQEVEMSKTNECQCQGKDS